LADRYKQSPTVFLNMPFSEMYLHLSYTLLLTDVQDAARAAKREQDNE